jgi:hypothetical protein
MSSISLGSMVLTPEGAINIYATTPVLGITISQNGNVGINTTNPTQRLSVSGNSLFTGGITVNGTITANSFAGNGAGLTNIPTASYSPTAITANIALTANALVARSNLQLGSYWLSGDGGNEGVFVSSNGYVGVGTNIPRALLDVAGMVSASSLTVGTITADMLVVSQILSLTDPNPVIALVTSADYSDASTTADALTYMGLDQFDNSTSLYVSSADLSTYIKPYALASTGKDEINLWVGTANRSLTANYTLTANYSVTANFAYTAITANIALTANRALTSNIALTANFSITSNYALTANYAITANKLVTMAISQFINDAGYIGNVSLVNTASMAVSMDAQGLMGAIRVLPNGNVGIGVYTPGQRLDVSGSIRLEGSTSGYVDIAPAAAITSYSLIFPTAGGGANKVLGMDAAGANLTWVANSGGGTASQWIDDGASNIYFNAGNVRIQRDLIVTGNASFGGTITANSFVGSGVSLNTLNATNIVSGTLGYARVDSSIITTNFNGGVSINGTVTANSFYGTTFIGTSFVGTATTANRALTSNIAITANYMNLLSNLKLNSNWLSNNGSNQGINIDNNGNVGVGTAPGGTYQLEVAGDVSAANVTVNGTVSTNSLIVAGAAPVLGYAINVFAQSTNLTGSGTPYYFGNSPVAPSTTAGRNKIYIRKAGYIRAMEIYSYAGTFGTTTAWSMTVMIGGVASAVTVANPAVAGSERRWSITGTKVAVNVGDYIEIRSLITYTVRPTTAFGGYVYIE